MDLEGAEARSANCHPEGIHPAQEIRTLVGQGRRGIRKMELGKAPQGFTDSDRSLQPRQWCADAEVHAFAERHVITHFAGYVEAIRVGKLCRVVIRRRQQYEAFGARRYRGPPDFYVGGVTAGGPLAR